MLGRYVDLFDFRQGSEFSKVDLSTIGDGEGGMWWKGNDWNKGSPALYPDDLFSPVIVVRGEKYLFGISLQYPVLKYKHRVTLAFFRPYGEKNAGASIDLKDSLKPGESRTYTISVRVGRKDYDWLKTVLPYRNYFAGKYGQVQYKRDPRPVMPVLTAFEALTSANNPYGYLNDRNQRPDLFGWGPWTQIMLGYRTSGFERVMLWTPTGVYPVPPGAPDYNYPMLFMTPMLTRPVMRDSLNELKKVPAAGMQMGYYQGYAGKIHFDWNDPRPEIINPDNPEHRRRGFAEIDLALGLNPDFIGLDAIPELPLWDALRWVEMLKARSNRAVRFLGEMTPSDIWLTRHASLAFAHLVKGPDRLADFLLPGHEIWSGIRYDILFPGKWNLPPETILAVMKQEAQMGRIPMPYMTAPMPNPSDYNAAPSWEYTVPTDLKDPCLR